MAKPIESCAKDWRKRHTKNSAFFEKMSSQKGHHTENSRPFFLKIEKIGVQVPSTWLLDRFASMEKSVFFETKKEPKHLIFSGFTRFASIVSWLYGGESGI